MQDKLVILDDIYPDIKSGWRVAEYSAILERFEMAEIQTYRDCSDTEFAELAKEYSSYFPGHVNRIVRVARPFDLSQAAFCYTLFVNGAYTCIDDIEQFEVPFAFVLYPGGGFGLDNAESDYKLRRVLNSPMFSGVVVTQPVTYDYIRQKHNVPDEKILRTYPGPMLGMLFAPIRERSNSYNTTECFHLGFIAMRYGNNLSAKGFDYFVATARELAKASPKFHFHVIGNHEPNDISLAPFEDRFTFHGPLPFQEMRQTMLQIHAVLSPNAPGHLATGGFDGFPTASCIEAGLVGTIIIATDPLNLNRDYTCGNDILLIERDFTAVQTADVVRTVRLIQDLAAEPERVNRLAAKTKETFRRVFSPDRQIRPRLDWIEELMKSKPEASEARWREAAKAKGQSIIELVREQTRLNGVIAEISAYMQALEEAKRYHAERADRLETELTRLNNSHTEPKAEAIHPTGGMTLFIEKLLKKRLF